MKWVDDPKYYGPDRRRRSIPRRPERRQGDELSGPIPSIPLAVRQLRLRLMDANRSPQGWIEFCDRVKGLAHLATTHGEHDIAVLVTRYYADLTSRDDVQRNRAFSRFDDQMCEVLSKLES